MNINGYNTITSYYEDFEKAEHDGINSVNNAFTDIFNECKGNYLKLTELAIILNCKMNEHNANGNGELAKIYALLWTEVDVYACDNLHGAESKYYLRTTD